MKKKDIATIIGAAVVSAIFAMVLSSVLISSSQERNQEAEVVEPITADFPEPSDKYFNGESINPTQLIRIGEADNPSPFNGN